MVDMKGLARFTRFSLFTFVTWTILVLASLAIHFWAPSDIQQWAYWAAGILATSVGVVDKILKHVQESRDQKVRSSSDSRLTIPIGDVGRDSTIMIGNQVNGSIVVGDLTLIDGYSEDELNEEIEEAYQKEQRIIGRTERYLQRVYRAAWKGDPEGAIETANEAAEWIRDEIARRGRFAKSSHLLYRRLAEVLFWKGRNERDIHSPDEVLDGTKSTFKNLLEIGYITSGEFGDEEALGHAHSHWGDAHYIAGKFDSSLDYFNRASSDLKDPLYLLQVANVTAKDCGYLNYEFELENVENKAKRFIGEGSGSVAFWDEVVSACYCLARAYKRLEPSKAFQYVKLGRKLDGLARASILRRLQLDIVQLELEPHLDSEQRQLLRPVNPNELLIARHYPRHEAQLRDLLGY